MGGHEDAAALSDARRRLLERMLAGDDAAPVASDPEIRPRPAQAEIPLSSGQESIWLHASMAPNQPLYNEQFTIRHSGTLDAEAFRRSVAMLVERHEIWRTSFLETDDGLRQAVHPVPDLPITFVDLQDRPAAEREGAALRCGTEAANRPFDLSCLPLFRITVVTLDAGKHWIFCVFHHIVFDGFSVLEVLVPELVACYDAYAAGQRPSLASPRLQFGDYAVWQVQSLETPRVREQLAYWQQRLAGERPVLNLPVDMPRPPRPSYHGGMETFGLSRPLSCAIREQSQRSGLTLHNLLMAAVKTLLHRYSGQQDIVIGGLSSTRHGEQLRQVPGYFLNALPVRSFPRPEMRFRDYALAVQDAMLGALAHDDVPFSAIVKALSTQQDVSRHPVFQVMVVMEPPANAVPADWAVSQLDVTVDSAKFDLYIEFDEADGCIIGRVLYSQDLFEVPTVRRLIGHLETLLTGLAADLDCRLASLPLLTEAETQALAAWNNTAAPFPQLTLQDWFDAQVARSPDRIAVESGSQSWSYRDLQRAAESIAAQLQEAGADRTTLVGISLEPSCDLLAGVLAILKTGAAYLPLDPGFPAARLTQIIEDAAPQIILTSWATADRLPSCQARRVFLGGQARQAFTPLTSGSPDDLAYVLYTSGSTGRPKGVEVPHGALVNFLNAMSRCPGFGATDSILGLTTLSFDIAGLELFLPLVSGGRVTLLERSKAADPAAVIEAIERAGCSVVQATPSRWRSLIDAGWQGRADLRVLCGGEALSRDLADALLARAGQVWNMYGPTETTIWSAVHRVEAGTGPVAIGRPIDNTTLFVLDASEQPVPVGVAGELYIGGAGVARGYRGRSELTRERFVSPASLGGNRRLYRTGDLARYRQDGTVECLGRNDNQVKIRGFRIEVEEVEAALGRHPAVAAAAVRTWPDRAGQAALFGYVVPRTGQVPGSSDLRAWLKTILPEYMAPSRLFVLESLPLTPNLKVDRNALPAPGADDPKPADQVVLAPADFHEAILVTIWKDVLGLASVNVTDSFFELGGHSLLITQLLSRIQTEFGIRLSLASVFEAPTIREMGRLLSRTEEADPAPIIRIKPDGSQPPLFWCGARAVFRHLAETLGSDQPFLGVPLQAGEMAALGSRFTIAEVARHLVRTIREAQPSGPYYIGGWCNWGVVAYEVGLQLIERGESVPLLVMLHPPHPKRIRSITVLDQERSKAKLHLGEIFRRRGQDRWNYAAQRAAAAFTRYKDLLAKTGRAETPEFKDLLSDALIAYRQRAYPGRVLLLQPIEQAKIFDHQQDWAAMIPGLSGMPVPGDHVTMLHYPNVETMGREIASALRATAVAERILPSLVGV